MSARSSAAAPAPVAPVLVLVGMPGSGKSTVGRLVAEHGGRPFVDLDAEIERRAGRSVPEVFASEGEAAFRRLETDALRAVLADDTDVVVATGGGVVVTAANRALLRSERTHVVWLRADLDTLVSRLPGGHGRPLLAEEPEEALRRLYAERSGLYADVADVVIDVDRLRPADVVDRVTTVPSC